VNLLKRFSLFRKKTPLEKYQDKLLVLLKSGIDPEMIKDILFLDKALKDYHSYIESINSDLLSVGSELAHKWGNRVS
jgi:hypothetical protein